MALVDVTLRGGELAYDLIDRLHGQGIRVVVMSGYADVLLPSGNAAIILEKPVSGTATRDLAPNYYRQGQCTRFRRALKSAIAN